MIHPAKTPMPGGFSLAHFAPSLDAEAAEDLDRYIEHDREQRRQNRLFNLVSQEVDRARTKYPEGDRENRFLAFAQEAGESFQAHAKWVLNPTPETLDAARAELRQAMAMAVRLYLETYGEP